jgi:hypothetical protein
MDSQRASYSESTCVSADNGLSATISGCEPLTSWDPYPSCVTPVHQHESSMDATLVFRVLTFGNSENPQTMCRNSHHDRFLKVYNPGPQT